MPTVDKTEKLLDILNQMYQCVENKDREVAHIDADALLMKTIYILCNKTHKDILMEILVVYDKVPRAW